MKRFLVCLSVLVSACTIDMDDGFAYDTEGESGTPLDPWNAAGIGDGDGDGDGDPPPMESECEYERVFEVPGPVVTLDEHTMVEEFMPLAPDEGFFCMKVEFDLITADNVDAMAADYEGCPEYLALASIYGAQVTGDFLATSFFRTMDELEDESCVHGEHRLEVGNYLHYTADTSGPWAPGQRWRVSLEAKPWLTRIEIRDLDSGELLGEPIVADLYPANIEDTRDTVVRLGQPAITGKQFFPWFGARYENLSVDAVVAEPPEE